MPFDFSTDSFSTIALQAPTQTTLETTILEGQDFSIREIGPDSLGSIFEFAPQNSLSIPNPDVPTADSVGGGATGFGFTITIVDADGNALGSADFDDAGIDQATFDLFEAVTAAALERWGEFINGAAGASLEIDLTIAPALDDDGNPDPDSDNVASAGANSFAIPDINDFVDENGNGQLDDGEILTIQAGSAFELITGQDVNDGAADINISVNSFLVEDDGFFVDDMIAPGDDVPAGQIDLFSVLLHEIGHGLGFFGLRDTIDEELPEFTLSDGTSVRGQTAFDIFTVAGDDETVLFNGPATVAAYGEAVELESGTGSGGSDLSHFAATPFGDDTSLALLNPFVIPGDRVDIGILELAALRDLGFDVEIPNDLPLINEFDDLQPGSEPVFSIDMIDVSLIGDQIELTINASDTAIFNTISSSVGVEVSIGDESLSQRVRIIGSETAQTIAIDFDTLLAGGDDGFVGTTLLDIDVRLFNPAQALLSNGTNEETTTVSTGIVLIGDSDAGNSTVGTNNSDIIFGRGGNDTIFGADGNDRIEGGEGNDRLVGNDGDDNIIGDSGDDSLRGNDGDDTLIGGDGIDRLVGDAGADTLDGGDGADRLVGGTGDDTIEGGEGNDSISAGADDDFVNGGAGDDVIFGQSGGDIIEGGSGDDRLVGNDGDDVLRGEQDNDRLIGGEGEDMLLGGQGDDRLIGGDGNDILDGELGDDVLSAGEGTDTLTDTLGNNVLFGEGGDDRLTTADGDDRLVGGDDDDVLIAGAGDDDLRGDSGNDQAFGGAGNDRLIGNAGDDILNGGSGVDRLVGGSGEDTLLGGGSPDTISGGTGADTINGGSGDDVLRGDADNDIFVFTSGFGNDRIQDYTDGDVLDVAALGARSLADVTITQAGSNTLVEVSGADGNSIELVGIDASTLDASDFVFMPGGGSILLNDAPDINNIQLFDTTTVATPEQFDFESNLTDSVALPTDASQIDGISVYDATPDIAFGQTDFVSFRDAFEQVTAPVQLDATGLQSDTAIDLASFVITDQFGEPDLLIYLDGENYLF